MRIVITADLHYRPADRDQFLAFADDVAAQSPDCLVVAGDIGHPLRLFHRALQLFDDLTSPRLFIAGNHDLYRGEFDSRTLWEHALPRATRAEGFVWLEDEVVRLGRVAIVGTMAWYDYSARAAQAPDDPAVLAAAKQLVIHDADYIDWPWSDVAMARYLARGFERRLQQAVQDPAVEQIVVVTHVPIFPEAVPERPDVEMWTLMRAYMGNFTLGGLVRRTPKVTHVISGHIHLPGQWTVMGDYGPLDVRLVGSQKHTLRTVTLDFA